MTQSDRWRKRPCVLRYFAFRDDVKRYNVTVKNGDSITFVMPVKKSYSKKKTASLIGAGHGNKPDLDNLLKALLDSIFDDDSHIYELHVTKIWGLEGKIIIQRTE